MEWMPSSGLIRGISSLLQLGLDFIQPESRLVRRIIRLGEAHDISRTQICRIFPHYDLTPTSFSSISNAKSLITANFIDGVSQTFNVNRKWLEGDKTSISNDIGSYGSPIEDIQEQLNAIQLIESDTRFRFLHLILPVNVDLTVFEAHTTYFPIALAFRVSHERDGIDFDTYHFTEVLCWDYQKARTHLRAILQLADERDFQLRGAYAHVKHIRSFESGNICFAELSKFRRKPCDPWTNIVNNKSALEEKLLTDYLAVNRLNPEPIK
ncbi:hypothetical protein [Neptuniibacter sp. 2_MG-2023]|uniref:hypothetical protein n=1 Tax=Neptuniibacter sp. 2_MG-2023 TaxID=3062671 RepID=UPI0026E12A57|nr:hypothetical protein [Neptuniibacter sp. 2_MG-2023]MDO6514476.1 hypothetical protein [Neptuniibacter sp. 2_MG-2023]